MMANETPTHPAWWPANPYPTDVFPMTESEYVEAVPNEDLRTAISGCLGRMFWDLASIAIKEQLQNEAAEMLTVARHELANEKLAVNVVKQEFWKGQLSVLEQLGITGEEPVAGKE